MASILKVDELQYTDGTPFELGSNPPTIQTFTASGTWTKPSGCKTIKVTVVGGGGGGGGASVIDSTDDSVAAGGNGGGCAIEYIDVSALSSVSVTVGAGGAGASAGDNDGSSGGTSSFGAYCSATGGGGGLGNRGIASGRSGVPSNSLGQGAGGSYNFTGNVGFAGHDSSKGFSVGGSSYLSGNAVSYTETDPLNATGVAGKSYGGGGSGGISSGTGNSVAGGVGASGVVIVEEFY